MITDLNVFEMGTFFAGVTNDIFKSILPTYTIGGETFDYGYFILDGIYQGCKMMVSKFSEPKSKKDLSFSMGQ